VRVTLPALWAIDLRENDNFVRQLLVPPWQGYAEVTTFKEGRSHGYTLKALGGGTAVLLLTNGAQPPENLDPCHPVTGAGNR
jgi:hypothetical protein